MTQVIRSDQRHRQDFGWLDARWHFSFGDYHDPKNMSFGALRVFNDDVVQPGGGFDDHPHRDMEIVTYVIRGQLEHRDHLGNRGIVHPGEVQVMSAGKGIIHAEYNGSKAEPVRLNQIWFMPRHKGNTPRWEQKQFAPADRKGRLLPVVTATEGDAAGALKIDADATVYVSSLKPGQKVSHETKATDRKFYVFVIDGAVKANGQSLSAGDQARIEGETRLDIEATAETEVMLIDLA